MSLQQSIKQFQFVTSVCHGRFHQVCLCRFHPCCRYTRDLKIPPLPSVHRGECNVSSCADVPDTGRKETEPRQMLRPWKLPTERSSFWIKPRPSLLSVISISLFYLNIRFQMPKRPNLAGTRGLEGPSTRISNLCFQVGKSRAPLLFILWHIHVCSDSTENKCLNSSVAGSPAALCEVNLLDWTSAVWMELLISCLRLSQNICC